MLNQKGLIVTVIILGIPGLTLSPRAVIKTTQLRFVKNSLRQKNKIHPKVSLMLKFIMI